MLVIFDTCAQPDYRRDLHRILSLPFGAVYRYEYKRSLCSKEAAAVLDAMRRGTDPINVILMYAEHNEFKIGADISAYPMLSLSNARFTPTRSARVVSVYVAKNHEPEKDVFHIHLELNGFIDPKIAEISNLIEELEGRRQLPFGDRRSEYCWVSEIPEQRSLMSENLQNWAAVVDWLVENKTQFQNDWFWRITGLKKARGSDSDDVYLCDRFTNRFGERSFHRDYPVHDLTEYHLHYQVYSPVGTTSSLPTCDLALVPDGLQEMMRIASKPKRLRPNQDDVVGFHVDPVSFFGEKHLALDTLTQTGGQPPNTIDPGSMCTLTFNVSKAWHVVVTSGLAAIGAICAGLYATLDHTKGPLKLLFGIVAALLSFLAYYSWTGKIKTPS